MLYRVIRPAESRNRAAAQDKQGPGQRFHPLGQRLEQVEAADSLDRVQDDDDRLIVILNELLVALSKNPLDTSQMADHRFMADVAAGEDRKPGKIVHIAAKILLIWVQPLGDMPLQVGQ